MCREESVQHLRLTRGRLQLFLQLSLLLTEGHECISYPVPLSLQLLRLFLVTFGILFSSRFPIPSILVGVWVGMSEESRGEGSNVQGVVGRRQNTSQRSVCTSLFMSRSSREESDTTSYESVAHKFDLFHHSNKEFGEETMI